MSRLCDYQNLLAGYDTILFDLDGTLYDQDRFYIGVFEQQGQWLEAQGVQKDPGMWINCMMGLKKARGNDYPQLIDDALELSGLDPALKPMLLGLYHGYDCRTLFLGKAEKEVLEYLQMKHKTMCIVTNGRRTLQERKIQRLGLHSYISQILILDPSSGDHLKPDPIAFQRICRDMSPGKTIMVGDRLDIDGGFAKNAGIDFLCVGFHGD
ncbi:MAG: HAD family hydrolase [Desulfobacteraceae bacterium]|nr:MAG: HAD family hydrolase [Desulfobacteraceae bacterium]